jgi:hypothetical protein
MKGFGGRPRAADDGREADHDHDHVLASFFVGAFLALLLRAELARPGMQFLSPEQYNQLLTMHGTIMLLFFATATVFAFANFVVPIQIGAPEVAFPRLNSFAYWLYLCGGTLAIAAVSTPGRRRRLRLDRLHAAEHQPPFIRGGREHVGDWTGPVRSGHHPRWEDSRPIESNGP